MMGGPGSGVTVRTPEIIDAIIAGLSEGTPLTIICRGLGIGLSTVYDWREIDPDFAGNFARARDAGWDTIAARTRLTARGDGDSKSDVQRDKLIIDTDLKLLAKWDKRYAEKSMHEHSGPDGGAIPVKNEIDFSKLAPEDRDAIRAIISRSAD